MHNMLHVYILMVIAWILLDYGFIMYQWIYHSESRLETYPRVSTVSHIWVCVKPGFQVINYFKAETERLLTWGRPSWCGGWRKMCVSAMFASMHVKAILIIKIKHITHVKHLGRLQGQTLAKIGIMEGWLSGEKTSMEDSRNMKFTHTVDQDVIKIIGEGKFI